MPSALDEYNKEIEVSVARTLARIASKQEKPQLSSEENPLQQLENLIHSAIKSVLNDDKALATIKLEMPPSHINSDYTISSFAAAGLTGGHPEKLSQELTRAIRQYGAAGTKEVTNLGPYVNIVVDKQKFYHKALNYFSGHGKEYGRSDINAGKVALMDFSSPNVAKPLGVGHMRSTIIGHALTNIYEWTGYRVVRDNHLGDWGTQFGELIYAYQIWGNEAIIEQNPIRELKNLYVKFHQAVQDNPGIKTEARRLFKELENGSETLLVLWKKFRDWSIADFQKVYRRLGIEFDTYIGESYFASRANEVIQECLARGVCRQDGNSPVVLVDSLDGVPAFILRKQDGSSLYITRDLAALKYRLQTFKPDVILYIVGSEQALNFQQLFTLGRKIGYLSPQIQVEHISFGLVLSEGEKMSTRRGTVIELEELMAKAKEKAREILMNNTALGVVETEQIAEIVGVGAIIYHDLRQSRDKNISFDWNRMINLETGSSAYLQYAHVRINSILARVSQKITPRHYYRFENVVEFDLAKKLLFFPQIISRAQITNAPNTICVYLEELAQQFHKFYEAASVIETEDNVLLVSRITLIKTVAAVLANGLYLLGIKIPHRM